MVASFDDKFRPADILRPLLVWVQLRPSPRLLQSHEVGGERVVRFEDAVVVSPLEVEERVLE